MLQQTQVAVVIPYFTRWMSRFPTIESLADASLDEVIKCWEGLGYYSRARNLHEGARYVLEHHEGLLPSDFVQLNKIKGLGPYTIGAIQSFAFHIKTPAVDANVIRVLARYFQFSEDISKLSSITKIWQLAHDFIPDEESWIVNEALIELGATLCSRNPQCPDCPLKLGCKSFTGGIQKDLPLKTKKIKSISIYRTVTVINCANLFLVKRGAKGEIMFDLHEFPFFETSSTGLPLETMKLEIRKKYALDVMNYVPLCKVTHGFTKYRSTLTPYIVACSEHKPVEGYQWVSFDDLKHLAFSSGHRRILTQLNEIVNCYS